MVRIPDLQLHVRNKSGEFLRNWKYVHTHGALSIYMQSTIASTGELISCYW